MLRLLAPALVITTAGFAQLSPEITVHPVAQHVAAGGSVTLSVAATGTAPLTYAWYRGAASTPFASGETVTLANVTDAHDTVYHARASNAAGTAHSRAVQVSVIPVESTAPRAVSVAASTFVSPATVLVAAPLVFEIDIGGGLDVRTEFQGGLPMTFQWRRDGVALPGQTHPQLIAQNLQLADAGVYTVTATNSRGSATSAGVTLLVRASTQPPRITHGVPLRFATFGAPANLAVQAVGTTPLSYQWLRNDQPIAGATNATLVLPEVRLRDSAYYSVRVTNRFGTSESGSYFAISNPPRLSNLAVRSRSGLGSAVLTAGFTLGGEIAGSAPFLLLRGAGPALASFGVTGTLADPVLTVARTQGGLAVSNDNWGGSATIVETAAGVGAFPFADPNGRDAAILTSFRDGGYTAQVWGNDFGSTGVALVEVYDTSVAPTTMQPRLTNLSARTAVGTGGDILIAGFAIAGSGPKTLLIRAIGPGLTPFGVGGVLADPILTLFAGSAKMGENDNWAGAAAIAAAASAVGAFAVPVDSRDAALLVTLPPGAYSAQVSGAGDTTGVALVEVYEVP